MITLDEAVLILRGWAEDGTSLRVDGNLPCGRFSLEGKLRSVSDVEAVVDLLPCGFLAISLLPDFGFDYFDPDSKRIALTERFGTNNFGDPVAYGAGVYAVRANGESVLFLTIAP